MLFLAVEVDAVARTEHHHFFLDGYFELTFYHVVIFLTVVSVLVRFAVARQWVNLHHERVHLSVLEAYGKALVFILVVAVNLRTLVFSCHVISLHARFLAEEQYIEVDAVSLGYLGKAINRRVGFARFYLEIMFQTDFAKFSHFLCWDVENLAKTFQSLTDLLDCFVHSSMFYWFCSQKYDFLMI